MKINLSIKKRLLAYHFLIQIIVLVIFSFSLYKAIEISTIDKLEATLKVIILDITDDLQEKNKILDALLDEEKEYKYEPLFIRILNDKNFEKIIQTDNFPKDIINNEKYLSNLKSNTISFEEQKNYFISRIKINYHNEQTVIIEAITTKDVITTTLENLLYILYFIFPIILIFAVIGGNFIIYKSFYPFRNILFELKQINANDLSSRLKPREIKDEISELVNEINNLLSRLENSFEKISQFSSDASHELKTPLTIIKGELEIALRKDRSIEEYKETINTSLCELSGIEQTINDLLFLAKNENEIITDRKEFFYLDEVVDESINELKNFAKLHKVEIVFEVEDNLEFFGFSNLLKIAIKNVLKNAIQFSFENSKVIVKIFEKDGLLNISIKDFGIGIPLNEQKNIFEKFYRTDKSRNKNSGGTGLGMSILKKIVDIHKGQITIESKENIETTVTISFNKTYT
ncbi:sensor histidine kinase [Aliarcobacter cibarius]|uniref:histidine kinase n=1 Tax=Aliarcobacter cibarius TaxID=255507 RepID=A0A7L5JNU8_9BACT|nr:ATP-binding protein [Aliarcobacter cibarius]QKJ26872.1 two-component system sensor histidine kinase [Aliarcobacter cibarius]TLS96014.1 two-component sensor histidine kinase [Aliarcobacter cibarius]TLS96631.1 two-component sensor histidine kinase [Aliarcobacter cibarius]TLT03080.1 two-component sensor histidine kinase [Aliarcobacter cibarius]